MRISYTSVIGNSTLERCESLQIRVEPNYAKLLPRFPGAGITEGYYAQSQPHSQFPIIGTLLALTHRGTIIPTTRKHGKDREQPKTGPKIGRGEVRPQVETGANLP
jgi:hypothetical protein